MEPYGETGSVSSWSLMEYLMSEYSPMRLSREKALWLHFITDSSCFLCCIDNFGLKSRDLMSLLLAMSSGSGISASFGLYGRSSC